MKRGSSKLIGELDPKDGGLQRLVFITLAGGRHERIGHRQWGTVTIDGRRFVAARMHTTAVGPHVYVEQGSEA